MKNIIREALKKFKHQIDCMSEEFSQNGLSPHELSKFERNLHDNLGELGRAVEKSVLEDADVEKDLVEYQGRRHYFKYKGPQEYECLFGKIEVIRSVYQSNGERTLCPLEVNGGIAHHHLTPAAAECVAHSMARMVPSEITDFFNKWLYLEPCETVIKQVAGEVGELAEKLQDHYESEIHKNEETAPEGTQVVAFSRDGTCVNIRQAGWRETMVGSISFYGEMVKKKDADDEEHRKRLRSLYVGQMPEEKAVTFNEKYEREINHALETVEAGCKRACIADGALGNWTFFESHPQLKDATHINDFYHAAEHLCEVSQALFGSDTQQAEDWFTKYRRVLKNEENGVEKLIRSIRYYKNTAGRCSKKRTDTIRGGLRYFTRNRSRMNYAKYRREGLPIGSGVIEAACKTVVGHRLKRAGMRWSIAGGQSILNLRTLLLSGRWEPFWKCHEDTLASWKVAV